MKRYITAAMLISGLAVSGCSSSSDDASAPTSPAPSGSSSASPSVPPSPDASASPSSLDAPSGAPSGAPTDIPSYKPAKPIETPKNMEDYERIVNENMQTPEYRKAIEDYFASDSYRKAMTPRDGAPDWCKSLSQVFMDKIRLTVAAKSSKQLQRVSSEQDKKMLVIFQSTGTEEGNNVAVLFGKVLDPNAQGADREQLFQEVSTTIPPFLKKQCGVEFNPPQVPMINVPPPKDFQGRDNMEPPPAPSPAE